jgi:hypothetical protein
MADRVEIDEIVTSVRVYDDALLLSPQLVELVAARVLPRVHEDELHRERVREEHHICPEGSA